MEVLYPCMVAIAQPHGEVRYFCFQCSNDVLAKIAS